MTTLHLLTCHLSEHLTKPTSLGIMHLKKQNIATSLSLINTITAWLFRLGKQPVLAFLALLRYKGKVARNYTVNV